MSEPHPVPGASPRIAVVGGGIAGSSVAMELAGRGAEVVVVERDHPGVGATGASAGMLAPQWESEGPTPAFRFGVAARKAYPAYVARIENLSEWPVGLRRDGMFVASRSADDEASVREALDYQHEAGLPGELLTVQEARRHHPELSLQVRSYLWLPDESQVDAQRLSVALADAVRAAGARLLLGRSVSGLTTRAGRVAGVRLADGEEVAADVVVLAAGAWSAELEGLPRPLPVRPVRGQILRLLPAEPVPWPLVADHAAHYLVPRENGTVLVGSTMEEAGFDDRVTLEGRTRLAEAATALVPSLEGADVVESWAGLRPISSDSWPILGPDPDLDGLLYATGHGRNGILFAPLVGQVVADLALTGSSEVTWRPFAVDRFTER